MSTSDVALCNRALASIGGGPGRSTIGALTESNAAARNCNLIFASTRDELMQMAFWNFAGKTDYLSLYKSAPGTPSNPTGATTWTTDYPSPPWLYEYGYPSDCLQVRFLVPQVQTGYTGTPFMSNSLGMYPYVMGPAARFEVASDTNSQGARINVVLTNQYQAIARYTMRITDPNLFGNNFEQALVSALAAKLTQTLTGDKGLANQKFTEANYWVTQARASDGNEGLTVLNSEAEWITARDGQLGVYGDGGYWMSPYSSLYAVY